MDCNGKLPYILISNKYGKFTTKFTAYQYLNKRELLIYTHAPSEIQNMIIICFLLKHWQYSLSLNMLTWILYKNNLRFYSKRYRKRKISHRNFLFEFIENRCDLLFYLLSISFFQTQIECNYDFKNRSSLFNNNNNIDIFSMGYHIYNCKFKFYVWY